MPRERRREANPKDEDFANPGARKMWYQTEKLLDDAPQTGYLKWHDVLQSWNNSYNEFIRNETPSEAEHLAWSSVAFFLSERMIEIRIESQVYANTRLKRHIAKREAQIIMEWNKILKENVNEAGVFSGKPPSHP